MAAWWAVATVLLAGCSQQTKQATTTARVDPEAASAAGLSKSETVGAPLTTPSSGLPNSQLAPVTGSASTAPVASTTPTTAKRTSKDKALPGQVTVEGDRGLPYRVDTGAVDVTERQARSWIGSGRALGPPTTNRRLFAISEKARGTAVPYGSSGTFLDILAIPNTFDPDGEPESSNLSRGGYTVRQRRTDVAQNYASPATTPVTVRNVPGDQFVTELVNGGRACFVTWSERDGSKFLSVVLRIAEPACADGSAVQIANGLTELA